MHQSETGYRQAFREYLRSGRRIEVPRVASGAIERKFNPYHDPRNGQFTFAPGGPRSLGHVIVSPQGGRWIRSDSTAVARRTSSDPSGRTAQILSGASGADYLPDVPRPPPRPGGNARAFQDPMKLQQVFPGLNSAAAASIIAVPDAFFNITGPANELIADLTMRQANAIIAQIRTVDPKYRLDTFGFPQTREGQANYLNGLRMDRASALYRLRQDAGPLQVETLRFLQIRVDAAYVEGLQRLKEGKLDIRLSPQEALVNFVDRRVRQNLRQMFNQFGISAGPNERVRVIGREYDTRGADRTYRVPDARVAEVAFDVTLTRKTLATPQVRGFFDADFSPSSVVIVRPSQLGPNSTYIIKRPGK